jgi:hypothetical protein
VVMELCDGYSIKWSVENNERQWLYS